MKQKRKLNSLKKYNKARQTQRMTAWRRMECMLEALLYTKTCTVSICDFTGGRGPFYPHGCQKMVQKNSQKGLSETDTRMKREYSHSQASHQATRLETPRRSLPSPEEVHLQLLHILAQKVLVVLLLVMLSFILCSNILDDLKQPYH